MVQDRKVLRMKFPITCIDCRMKIFSNLVIRLKFNNVFPVRVLAPSDNLIPWFSDFANYMASDLVPLDLYFHQS